MSNAMSEAELQRRREWFQNYVRARETDSTYKDCGDGQRFACPCCGCLTLDARGDFDICQVCFWEDDGQDEQDADLVRGGPNGSLSLTAARSNFLRTGAVDERALPHVREPTEVERGSIKG